MKNYKIPTLTIAGSDSCGGAGIQADLKTFSAIGTYGMSVVTAITAQNTLGVIAVEDLSEGIIRKQIEAIFNDIRPSAIKIGMVSDEKIIKVIAKTLKAYKAENIILDPVMISKSGYSLLKKDAKVALIKELLPIATIATPNIPEAEEILGIKIESIEEMKIAAEKIREFGPEYVLLKGGHLKGEAVDILISENTCELYMAKRINRKNTHGTGCTLSSAITSYIALGYDIKTSVKMAKDYITKAIENSFDIGNGVGPVHHFFDFE